MIELLVVILIVGILTGIAIPSFLGQRESASDSDAKSAARTALNAAETYYVEHVQTYDGISRARLVELEPTLADAPWSGPWCTGGGGVSGGGQDVCVAMESRGSRRGQFEIRRQPSYGPGITRLCSNAGVGGCKRGGSVPNTGTW